MELEKRLALTYRKIVSDDSLRMNENEHNNKIIEKIDDNHQVKRNDVHYLLKQLNSFSDIEKIDIVDIKQKQEQHNKELENENEGEQRLNKNFYDNEIYENNNDETQQNIEKYSPTTRSLILISPTAGSLHKGMRRHYSSLYQKENELPAKEQIVTAASNAIQQQQLQLQQDEQTAVEGCQQFDDYIFQSCHYLEASHFAANYRSSHEFRPSITGGTSATYSSHSSLHACTNHEYVTEASNVAYKSSTLPLSSYQAQDNHHQHHIHHSHPYATVHAQQPPVLGPPARRFQLQTRLTNSGVQTELMTPSSLSNTTTNASLHENYGKNYSKSSRSSHATSLNSADIVFCRFMPIFKCCYTPIDRWCERRNAASQQQQQQQQTTTTPATINDVTMVINDLTKRSAGAGDTAI